MMDRIYVFVPYDVLLYSLQYMYTSYQVLKNNLKLQEAYDDVLTIIVESQEKNFYQAYTKAAARGEISEKLESDWVSTDLQVIMSKKLKNQKVNFFSIKSLLFHRKPNQQQGITDKLNTTFICRKHL